MRDFGYLEFFLLIFLIVWQLLLGDAGVASSKPVMPYVCRGYLTVWRCGHSLCTREAVTLDGCARDQSRCIAS